MPLKLSPDKAPDVSAPPSQDADLPGAVPSATSRFGVRLSMAVGRAIRTGIAGSLWAGRRTKILAAAAFSQVAGLPKAVLDRLKAGLRRRRWTRTSREQERAKPAWEAPATTRVAADKGPASTEILGLVVRLGLVALLIGCGLVVVFLNTGTDGPLQERLKRAAGTGSIFSQTPTAAPTSGPDHPTSMAEEGVAAKEGHEVAIIGSPRLLTPPAARTTPQLVRLALVSPKKICKAIDPGEDFMAWNESLLLDGHWECYATATAAGERVARQNDLEDTPATEDPDAVVEPALPSEPQLFVMARGDGRDALTNVRIKLIADSAAGARRGAARLAELAGALFDVLQWRPPDGFLEKLAGLEDLEVEQAGTRLRFKRELSAGWQYNLIVIFPNPKIYSQGSAFHPPEAAEGAASSASSPPASRDDP